MTGSSELTVDDAEQVITAIRDAIGMADDETLEVVTPQFERQDGVVPAESPLLEEEFDALKDLSSDELSELGLRCWSDDLWLFPGEWYPHIPEGYEVTTINDEIKEFVPGEASRDIRFGCLAYGIEVNSSAE